MDEKTKKTGRPKKNPEINEIQQEAMFWFYVGLGEKRTLDKVAEHFNVPLWMIKDISTKNEWTKRLNDIQSDDTNISEITKYAESVQMSVLSQIINNPSTKPADKIKALDALNKFLSRSSELVKKKKIVIEFKNRNELQRIVEGLKTGEIYRELQ